MLLVDTVEGCIVDDKGTEANDGRQTKLRFMD